MLSGRNVTAAGWTVLRLGADLLVTMRTFHGFAVNPLTSSEKHMCPSASRGVTEGHSRYTFRWPTPSQQRFICPTVHTSFNNTPGSTPGIFYCFQYSM